MGNIEVITPEQRQQQRDEAQAQKDEAEAQRELDRIHSEAMGEVLAAMDEVIPANSPARDRIAALKSKADEQRQKIRGNQNG